MNTTQTCIKKSGVNCILERREQKKNPLKSSTSTRFQVKNHCNHSPKTLHYPIEPSITSVSEAAQREGMCWSASALRQACWGAPGVLRPWPSPCSCHGTPRTSRQPAFHDLLLILGFWAITDCRSADTFSAQEVLLVLFIPFVEVPGLPLGLDRQVECLLPNSTDRWILSMYISTCYKIADLQSPKGIAHSHM